MALRANAGCTPGMKYGQCVGPGQMSNAGYGCELYNGSDDDDEKAEVLVLSNCTAGGCQMIPCGSNGGGQT